MARNIDRLAELLGAKRVARVPETGGGAWGAARLSHIVAELQSRLEPGKGRRSGRPTDARWIRHPKLPMSAITEKKLARLAAQASESGRRVSPMQIAASILEEALAGVPEE